jgi:hypothetical protein
MIFSIGDTVKRCQRYGGPLLARIPRAFKASTVWRLAFGALSANDQSSDMLRKSPPLVIP